MGRVERGDRHGTERLRLRQCRRAGRLGHGQGRRPRIRGKLSELDADRRADRGLRDRVQGDQKRRLRQRRLGKRRQPRLYGQRRQSERDVRFPELTASHCSKGGARQKFCLAPPFFSEDRLPPQEQRAYRQRQQDAPYGVQLQILNHDEKDGRDQKRQEADDPVRRLEGELGEIIGQHRHHDEDDGLDALDHSFDDGVVAQLDHDAGERDHDERRRQHDRDEGDGAARHSADLVADITGKLGRDRSRQRVAERQRLAEFLRAHPAVAVDDLILVDRNDGRPAAVAEQRGDAERVEQIP
ncbi:hypothetical protein BN871_EL_00140 [Paenibacillus sp. P22]|nr:hypothetical protein BN871_EL_00140 [Paenibacillus sp. P22]